MIHIGQRLREERIRKKLTLEEVSKETKIRINFLSSIEKGEYQKLPSRAYAYGFVKNYADFLGLPKNETLALFRREFNEDNIFKVLPEGFIKSGNLSVNRLKIQENIGIIIALIFILAAYIFFQYRYAFINPPLEVFSPKEKEILTSKEITVSGRTEVNATILVNNVSVPVDKEGNFKKNIDLFPGKTIVKIKAVNRFNKETEIERNIEIKTE